MTVVQRKPKSVPSLDQCRDQRKCMTAGHHQADTGRGGQQVGQSRLVVLNFRTLPISAADGSTLRATTDRSETRTISCSVLSAQFGSVVIVTKIAAARQTRPSMTAFDPAATFKRQSTDREFLTQMYGPAVRCKKFRRSGFSGLASMYPASEWSGVLLRAIMDFSARPIS